jgi:uncharacterized protein (DUF58 family)
VQARRSSHQQPVRGAYTELSDLIGLRFAAQQLPLHADRQARAAMVGNRSTRIRGRGIEFEEVRQYQAGDDIRTIDWRVTARSGKPHTKMFREERERPTLLCVDQRQNMFFGSRTAFKSVVAAHIAALIGWATLEHGDRVGGLVFNDESHCDIRARRHRQTVLQLLNQVHQFNRALPAAANTTPKPFEAALKELQRIAKPGYQIVLVSDFHGWDDSNGEGSSQCLKRIAQLSQHCEIVAIGIHDPLEAELPPPGRYGVSDGNEQMLLDTYPARLREHYRSAFADRRQSLKQHLNRHGIAFLDIATDIAVLPALQQFWGTRR